MAQGNPMPAKDVAKYGLILLHVIVIGLAIYAWGLSYRWHFTSSIYQLFPLIGLLAFSFMWLHYVTAAVNRLTGNLLDTKKYYEITESIVFGLILLHPGLFLYQLWHDGLGLPPGSYAKYVGMSNKIFVLIALLALSIFLLYEFKEKLAHTRFWPYMVWLNNFAVVLIFIHAWRLGGVMNLGWFRVLWVVYFVVFIFCLAEKYLSPNSAKPST